MSRERRTQIIAIRVPPAAKKRILEEAQKREETLTDFLFELIGAGRFLIWSFISFYFLDGPRWVNNDSAVGSWNYCNGCSSR